jgi:hypothetical protein
MPGRVDARYTAIIRVSEPTLGRTGRNSTNRSAPATAVCPVCNKRFERGRHRNQFHRAGAKVIESSRYCSPTCRQSAWRTRRDIRNEIPRHQRRIRNTERKKPGPATGRKKPGAATTLHASVTRPKISQRFQYAGTPKKPILGPRSLQPGIVPDERYPGMYRLRLPDGSLSDVVNLTRAKDALAAVHARSAA